MQIEATRHPRKTTGFTWIELLVSLAIVAVLVALAWPAVVATSCGSSAPIFALSNMRQLCLATQQMAQDGTTTGETNLGWPGDAGGTFSNWARQLVPSYLSTNDFCKLLSVPGRMVPSGSFPMGNTNGIVVYAASDRSPTNVVFLSTANISSGPGGPKFDTASDLLKGKSFVVFHRGGDGAILLPRQITNTAVVGTFVPLCK